jgi:putative chitinase
VIPFDAIGTQLKLGVTADGIFGQGSFNALLIKCGATKTIAEDLAFVLASTVSEYGLLDNALRLQHFLTQLGHESDGYKAMEEYATGKAYEGRKDLGNIYPGDGVRYKGRGPIQITGRSNYRKFGKLIGINLEKYPELASNPCIGMRLALEYWKDKNLNAYADVDEILTITKRINGGTNGLEDRIARLKQAKLLVK